MSPQRSYTHDLFGDRDTDLGGNEILMRPPKILGLRTSPVAWETERDNTLKSLKWVHEEVEYRLLPCHGSPCLWTVVPMRPG